MRRYGLAALVGAMVVGAAPIAWAQSAPPAGAPAAQPPAQAPAPPPAAAAHTPGDPWERLNRFNYAIESALDRHLIIPITHIYAAITPGPIGRGIHNVLVNLSEPTVFFNDVLQGRIKQAGVTAGRFMTNSTIGVAGLIDVANKWGLPHHNNEFGVTLGHYGVHPGPYMYLPLGGPTTLRDLVGSGVDLLMDPFHWARFASQGEASGVRLVVGGIDTREAVEAQLNTLLSEATDPYATLRSVYLQNKQSEIDGGTAPLDLPSFDAPLPTPAPPGPTAANLFPDASSEIQPDAQQKAVDDAAALKLMSQPYGLASADLDRAAQLGQTLGGVRVLEKSLAARAGPAAAASQDTELAGPDAPAVTLASDN
ncbi:MAG TPA: VacJ family lipoprotein [Caulobacteraceae bacterium]|jgi:phospholipid-binding lipoprotein MlaA